MAKPRDPVFVLGAPRSGTTLLRVMLQGNPRLFSPPEMIIAPFATMQERRASLDQRYWEKGGLRRTLMELCGLDVDAAKSAEAELEGRTVPEVYAFLMERLGERVLVDKCPHLCAAPEALARVGRWFPEARYVWIVRHPGSVIRSIENMPYAEVMLQGYADDPREVWVRGNQVVEEFLGGVPQERWMRLRYEDLVNDGRPELERLCRTIGVDFVEAMLDPYEGDRMREGPKGARAVGDPNMASRGRIQPELATSWLEGFDPASVSPATREMARKLGYDLDAMPRPPLAGVTGELDAMWSSLRRLEHHLRVPMDVDAVEGRRFLLRILGASLDTFVEQADTERPTFVHAEGPSRKMFADNPDTDYLRAPIDLRDGAVYRVEGNIPPGTTYAGVVLYRRGGTVGKHLRDDQLRPSSSGDFVLWLSASPDPKDRPGVWLQGDGDETAVMLRQYFTDRRAAPRLHATLRKQGTLRPPEPLRAAALARSLERSRRMVEQVLARTTQTYEVARTAALNTFIEVPGDQLFPTPDNRYRVCWYRIGDDQVMLVRGRLPEARYFGLCLYNAWMESLDYERHRIHRNHTELQPDGDGNFEVCIAHRDPGHPCWIETAGHNAGYVLARALLAEGDLAPLQTEILYESEWRARRDTRVPGGARP